MRVEIVEGAGENGCQEQWNLTRMLWNWVRSSASLFFMTCCSPEPLVRPSPRESMVDLILSILAFDLITADAGVVD